ncbi:hypothetical protein GIB67_026416 [Kingdonia uniflora]|uniref:Uncharacterized protein n=1 Tax=Kingdonia uniflora TaxID=39325 RepID=A0A7J7P6X0_9MAGN|nr:hypothetical protein GIB67_026416 [Kingdonia uniflora]
MMANRCRGLGFGWGMFETKTLPHDYTSHRCKAPGHLFQHCPTNGYPNCNIKELKLPTGIPKSMLVATQMALIHC